jgi:predicted nucleic acid-binding protein
LKQLVLDAGPLIALFSVKDVDHQICKAGFEQLSPSQTILLTPIPIVFEVYKWLLHRTTPVVAQDTLNVMRESLHTVSLSQLDFHELNVMVQALPRWQGSLEDATVILLAQRYRCPVWTLNYRDFGIFKSLEFWNPE